MNGCTSCSGDEKRNEGTGENGVHDQGSLRVTPFIYQVVIGVTLEKGDDENMSGCVRMGRGGLGTNHWVE